LREKSSDILAKNNTGNARAYVFVDNPARPELFQFALDSYVKKANERRRRRWN
jgi:hypothetical protein